MSENHLIFFANSKINKEMRRNQRRVADDVSDDALRRLVKTKVEVFGRSLWSQRRKTDPKREMTCNCRRGTRRRDADMA